MTDEQNIAYINTQNTCALIELEAMKVQNKQDKQAGREFTFSQQHFHDLICKYGIHHNAVVSTLYNQE